jgi:nitrogen regulatory protein PII
MIRYNLIKIGQRKQMTQFYFFLRLLKESFRDLIPIVLVILIFQLGILQVVPEGWVATTIGMVIVGIGLAIFLQGLEIGIFPVGEKLASDFAHSGSTFWILIFAFAIGFGTTIAEPALAVIADKAAAISSGRIDANTLRYVVALSVGFAILLGVYRIIKGHPIHYYIIAGYIGVVGVTFLAPKEIVGLAYDLGGVTTSTVTVPLVAALGIGLASTIKGRDPVIDGFGLIAFASLTPMIFVQIYGIFVYNFVEATEVAQVVVEAKVSEATTITLQSIVTGILAVVRDVLPILAVIFFFQYAILKKKIDDLKTVIIGFILVILGLYAFILGLEMGLFALGESMAYQLTKAGNMWVIYIFAFAIGFSTTMAEPALMAIAKKAKDISGEKIRDSTLRMFGAVGVVLGISLGALRVVDGGHIHYYIIIGYMIVVALTFIAPKHIIPIAYDSGGVTTSTVTVPLVAALGIGLATNIEGRDPLIDGFGLIAFASLFPMITVMAYGIIAEKFHIKSDSEIADEEEQEQSVKIHGSLEGVDDMSLSTINLDATNLRHSMQLDFSAIIIIVPTGKEKDALHAAKEAGASGVTIVNASGMGLAELDNFYRHSPEESDKLLLFIVPTQIVDGIIKEIVRKLHITTTGDGIAFSVPISHMKGISMRQEDLFEKEVEELKATQQN